MTVISQKPLYRRGITIVPLFLVLSILACNNSPEEGVKVASDKKEGVHRIVAEIPASPADSTPLVEIRPASSVSEKTVLAKNISRSSSKENPFRQLYRNFEEPPQMYQFSTTHDTIITCLEGTKVAFHAGSLVSARTGKEITGEVKIEVKEFYGMSDILRANLTTMSGGKQLESGGMIYIAATQDGEECRLKPSATVDLEFPYETEPKEGMRLFTGEWKEGRVEWIPMEGQPTSVSISLGAIGQVSKPARSTVDRSYFQFNDTTASNEVKRVEIRSLPTYSRSAQQLGWINCDRFIQEPGPKVQFVVDPGTTRMMDVKLIFHRIKSVMPGMRGSKGFLFSNVPEGEDVTIIAVKFIDEQMYVASRRTRVTSEGVGELVFEPTTVEGLNTIFETASAG